MATIVGTTGGIGTRAIATRYPVTVGIIAGTTRQPSTPAWLVPEKSLVPGR